MRFRVCSTSRLVSKLRAQPPDIEERPQSDTSSQRVTRGRFSSTRRLPLNVGRWHRFRNTSSKTMNHMTRAMSSTSIADRSTETPRNEATMHTVAGDTTTTRTEGLLSHWALESLAAQSATRHCPNLFAFQRASPSTMARPNPSYGWWTSGWHTS